MKIARLIGAAGSGKTTELLRIMEAALPKLGGDPLRLGFASFTRAARAEAVGRAAAAWNVAPSHLDGDGWFRTVHSTAKRCLGIEKGQLIGNDKADTEWISNALGVRVSTSIDEETGSQRFVGGQEGAALTCWQRARNTLQPLNEIVRRMRQLDDDVPDFAAVVRIAERYELAKRVADRLDFCDLLTRFCGFRLDTVDGVERVEPEGELPRYRRGYSMSSRTPRRSSTRPASGLYRPSPLRGSTRLEIHSKVSLAFVVGRPSASSAGLRTRNASCRRVTAALLRSLSWARGACGG